MRRKLTSVMFLGVAIVVTAPAARPVLATPAGGGFASTTLALDRFGDINVFNHLIPVVFSPGDHHFFDGAVQEPYDLPYFWV